MSKLSDLIATLTRQVNSRHPDIMMIKHPVHLIKALKELNDIVGMCDVKDDIADQVIFLIMATRKGEKSKYMLNTIFYGPPGVGKTKVGVILANIWWSMGFIEKRTIETTSDSDQNWNNIYFLVALLIIVYIIQFCAYMYGKNGLFFAGAIVAAIILFGIIFYLLWELAMNEMNNYHVEDDTYFRIISRADFVAPYVGQTAIKTMDLLNKNRGKVLFIDEAYSLLNDDRDSFGMEALTALNQFMSENPQDIVIIFAGYKDKMQSGIFEKQPGLPRRCMWHFECEGYSGSELYDIFKTQLKKEKWSITDEDVSRQMFIDNKAIFPSYGGDTERLCFFAKLESNREAFHNGSEVNSKLNSVQIRKGMELLQQNNIKKDHVSVTDKMAELYSKLRS